jgi:hypothetical protein
VDFAKGLWAIEEESDSELLGGPYTLIVQGFTPFTLP